MMVVETLWQLHTLTVINSCPCAISIAPLVILSAHSALTASMPQLVASSFSSPQYFQFFMIIMDQQRNLGRRQRARQKGECLSFRCMAMLSGGVTAVAISQNGMEHLENTEQLCKSSLKCLISTKCISLDRTQQALHARTLEGRYMGGAVP